MYEYAMTLERVVDGDTLVATIDLGMHVKITKTVRMLDYNAPEMFGGHAKCEDEVTAGKLARNRLISLFNMNDAKFVIQTQLDRDDKYGRVLGRIVGNNGTSSFSVNAEMAGFADALWAELKHTHPDLYK